jgi:quercetin dioxygenase-like cupin family protein
MSVRQAALGVGLLALVVSLGRAASAADSPEPAAAATESEAAKISLQLFDRVQPQEYPWGWIRWMINGEVDPQAEMVLGVVYIKPQQTNPLHLHPNSAEYLHVVEGSCEHRVGDKWVTVRAGDTLRIPQGVKHQARTKDESCRAVIVYNTGRRIMTPVEESK